MEANKIESTIEILKEFKQLEYKLKALQSMADTHKYGGALSLYQFENTDLQKEVNVGFTGQTLKIDRRIEPFDIALSDYAYIEVLNFLIKLYSKRYNELKAQIQAI